MSSTDTALAVSCSPDGFVPFAFEKSCLILIALCVVYGIIRTDNPTCESASLGIWTQSELFSENLSQSQEWT